MAWYEAGNLSSIVTSTIDNPLAAIRVPTTEVCFIREIGIMIIAATATRIGLARATTVSVTPGTTKPGRNYVKGAPDSGTLLVSSFGTAPVISTNYLRRSSVPATIGAGFIWTWPSHALQAGDGINTSELVLANIVAAIPSAFEYWVAWES